MMNINIKQYDILGVNPQLYVNSEKRKQTDIGGFTSIILIILLILLISYFFLEVFMRNSFSVISHQITDTQPKLNLTYFPLSLGLVDKNAQLISLEGQVRIEADFREISQNYKQEIEKKITVITLEKCNKSVHFQHYSDLIDLNKFPFLEKFFCLPGYLNNLTLLGNWGDSINPNSIINVNIYKCINNQNNFNISSEICKNETIINANLLHVYLNVLYVDFDIDHNDYENPGKPIIRSETFPLSSTTFNIYNVRKKIVKYQTDTGFFFPDTKKKIFFQDEGYNLITNIYSDYYLNGLFGKITISLSKKTDIVVRNYLKLQSALANIGGIVEGIFFIFSFITKYFMKKNYYSELGKSSYKFSEDPQEKLKYFQPFNFKDYKKQKIKKIENETEGNFKKDKLCQLQRGNKAQK